MKTIRRRLFTSITANVLLIVTVLLLGVYFFIGLNAAYLSKTQAQMNNEIIELLKDSDKGTHASEAIFKSTKFERALQKASEYNVGLNVLAKDGGVFSQQLDENRLILRLEIGGRLKQQQVMLPDLGRVDLVYFSLFLSGGNTVKLIPVFLRMTLILLIFSYLLAVIVAWSNSVALEKDLLLLRVTVSNLVKGSFIDTETKVKHSDLQEMMSNLATLRVILEKREGLKKRMTADFAHELRTPLTTLQSHLEALIDGVWEPTTERFLSCHEEILRLIRLVGDLEKLSKVEDDNIILNKSTFDLTDMVRHICINFQGEFNNKGVSLTFRGEAQEMLGDKDKLGQVVVNLLSNSLKYSVTGKGRILLDVAGDKDYVYLIINDSGIGIPVKDVPHVFNRLYRSDTSRARNTGGAGIGLAIAKSIIEAHRGSIDIVSQEGLGTELSVILPRK